MKEYLKSYCQNIWEKEAYLNNGKNILTLLKLN